jgi:hypothetical protein
MKTAQLIALTILPLAMLCNASGQSRNSINEPDGGVYFRIVTNQVFDVRRSILWTNLTGKVSGKHGDVILLSKRVYISLRDLKYEDRIFAAIRNYPESAVQDKLMHLRAMKVGRYDTGTMLVELYDCGIPAPARLQANADPAVTNTPAKKNAKPKP